MSVGVRTMNGAEGVTGVTGLPALLDTRITTEFGVTLFQLSAGVFGGVAALVAARRLEQAPDTIPITSLAVPVAIAGISTVLGAMLLPTGEETGLSRLR